MRPSRLGPLLVVVAVIVVFAVSFALRMRNTTEPVPPYALRSGDGQLMRLRSGQRFRLDLAPRGAVHGPVGVRAYLVQWEEAHPWNAPFKVERDGSVHVEGTVDALFAGVDPGRWTITVAVGRPDALPTDKWVFIDPSRAPPGDAPFRIVRQETVLGDEEPHGR